MSQTAREGVIFILVAAFVDGISALTYGAIIDRGVDTTIVMCIYFGLSYGAPAGLLVWLLSRATRFAIKG
jgi:hypothetical protein